MKKIIGTLALLTFLFSSCGNRNTSSSDVYQEINEQQVNTTLSYAEEAETLNDLLQKQEAPVQIFQVSSSKQSKITGRHGTVVHIRPGNLETVDGEPVGDKIEIELKECTHQEALFRSNVQTVSNGQLLVSGGAYYINMTSDGKQLKIKDGKMIEMDFPVLADDEMELFYGQRDSLGRMNWLVVEQKLERKEEVAPSIVVESVGLTETPMVIFEVNGVTDTVKNFSQEEFERMQAQRMAERAELEKRRKELEKEQEKQRKLQSELYNSVSVNQLGWINVDRFLKMNNVTNVTVEVEDGNVTNTIAIYLVFKDINSVINTFYKKDATRFSGIPVGYEVRLIAFAMDKDENYYSYSSDFTVKKDEKRSIKLQKTDGKDWDKLFDLRSWCEEGNKAVSKVMVVD